VGIDNLWLHDLRRTFATRLAQAGVDLYKISKLLGHRDIKMTQRYAHHCPDSLRDGVEILEVDYNLTTMSEKECSKSL
jgi:site-specific recombinase XerD